MEEKHKLTEKLKVLETKIHDAKVDLRGIDLKLNMAYQYETELEDRKIFAKDKTEKLRQEHYKKMAEITQHYNVMTDIFDVFTGNFYKD